MTFVSPCFLFIFNFFLLFFFSPIKVNFDKKKTSLKIKEKGILKYKGRTLRFCYDQIIFDLKKKQEFIMDLKYDLYIIKM